MSSCAFIKAVFSILSKAVSDILAANENIAKRQTGISIYCNMHTKCFYLTQCAGMIPIRQSEKLNLFGIAPFEFLTTKSIPNFSLKQSMLLIVSVPVIEIYGLSLYTY